ncbi:hypothetical protein ABK040_002127 [Willaertia magna]
MDSSNSLKRSNSQGDVIDNPSLCKILGFNSLYNSIAVSNPNNAEHNFPCYTKRTTPLAFTFQNKSSILRTEVVHQKTSSPAINGNQCTNDICLSVETKNAEIPIVTTTNIHFPPPLISFNKPKSINYKSLPVNDQLVDPRKLIACNNNALTHNGAKPNSNLENNEIKEKKNNSLLFICSRFIEHYETQHISYINLDETVNKLDIDKRRLYDVLNVLLSLGIASKVKSKQYLYNGMIVLTKTFDEFRIKAFKDSFLYESISKLPDTEESLKKNLRKFQIDSTTLTSNEIPSKTSNKKDTFLMILCKQMIMIFLITEMVEISQEHVTQILLRDVNDKTKLRRLNDIINVLISLKIIEKQTADNGKRNSKVVLRWSHPYQIVNNDTTIDSSGVNKSNKEEYVPLKKRKRMKITVDSGVSLSTSEDNSPSPTLSSSSPQPTTPKISPSISPVTLTSLVTQGFTTLSTGNVKSNPEKEVKEIVVEQPKKRSSLHFQFLSPPTKKNKTLKTILSTTLGGNNSALSKVQNLYDPKSERKVNLNNIKPVQTSKPLFSIPPSAFINDENKNPQTIAPQSVKPSFITTTKFGGLSFKILPKEPSVNN